MTEAHVERTDDDSDSEEQNKGADASPAISSQPQRVALFPGVDPSALKVGFNLNRGHNIVSLSQHLRNSQPQDIGLHRRDRKSTLYRSAVAVLLCTFEIHFHFSLSCHVLAN